MYETTYAVYFIYQENRQKKDPQNKKVKSHLPKKMKRQKLHGVFVAYEVCIKINAILKQVII
jgi:hypothetical protein